MARFNASREKSEKSIGQRIRLIVAIGTAPTNAACSKSVVRKTVGQMSNRRAGAHRSEKPFLIT
jgi:hypothetical protein